jgi:type II secretory pathway predicted ATPase ExeA
MSYRAFFGLGKEPFSAEIPLEDILITPELDGVRQRLEYLLRLGAIMLVTGDVGAGKSTARRYSCAQLHPSRYKVLWITASAGAILEIYRQLLAELDIVTAASSRAVLTRLTRRQVDNLVSGKKQQPVMVVDEASLLRLDVFAELHTITQFEADSKPWLPMVLAGQNNLAQNLLYRTAIPQGSGGLLRKANHLACGALIVAAAEKATTVTDEHVRLADSELF